MKANVRRQQEEASKRWEEKKSEASAAGRALPSNTIYDGIVEKSSAGNECTGPASARTLRSHMIVPVTRCFESLFRITIHTKTMIYIHPRAHDHHLERTREVVSNGDTDCVREHGVLRKCTVHPCIYYIYCQWKRI